MKNIFKYLKQNSTNPFDVDRLIISAFLKKNNIIVLQSIFIKSYIIQEANEIEYKQLNHFISELDKEIIEFNIENLIQLFEFVIFPPSDSLNFSLQNIFYWMAILAFLPR